MKNPSATSSAGEVPLTGNISPPKSTKKRRKKKKKKGKKAPPSNDHENTALEECDKNVSPLSDDTTTLEEETFHFSLMRPRHWKNLMKTF